MSIAADAIERHLQEKTLLVEAPLDDTGTTKRLYKIHKSNSYLVTVVSANVENVVWCSSYADEAVQAYDKYTWRPWHAAYRPRGLNDRSDDKTFHVFAVGDSIRSCIDGFADSLGEIVDESSIAFLHAADKSEDSAYQWSVEFTMRNGAAMKAAGVFVPGGVVMTWWK